MLSVVLLGLSLFLWYALRQPALPEGVVSGNGRIEATEYDIAAKQAGRLDSVFVNEGDMVVAGRTLARMNEDDLVASLDECEAQIRLARNEKLRASAMAAQQAGESSLADKDYARYRKLFDQDVISRQELDHALTKREGLNSAVSATQAQVAEAGSAIEAVIAKSRIIRNNIEDCRLKAPVDGRVLYRLAEPGEVLPAGGRVLTVLDLSDAYMTIFLPSEMAGRLVIGSEARIVLDAFPRMVIPASVSFVSSRAQFTPKEVETSSEREMLMFRIKLKIDPELLRTRLKDIKTGLTGVGYVRLSSSVAWPEALQLRISR